MVSPYGLDVQPIVQILELIPADIAGWTAVVAGLAVYAAVLVKLDPARAAPAVIDLPVRIERFEPNVEFQKIMDVSLAELRVRPDLLSMQKQARMLVDATDHAVNRLRADLAQVTELISPPTFEPLRQLAHEPVAVPAQRQPLAA